MKKVTYEGESAYCVVEGTTFRKGVELEVSNEVAAAAKKVEDEKFSVSDTETSKTPESGD